MNDSILASGQFLPVDSILNRYNDGLKLKKFGLVDVFALQAIYDSDVKAKGPGLFMQLLIRTHSTKILRIAYL